MSRKEMYRGNFTFKRNIWGSLILYIEILIEDEVNYTYWRKAKFTDLPYLKLKSEL